MKLTKEQEKNIKEQQSQGYKTKRVTATELEKILSTYVVDEFSNKTIQ